MKPITICLTYFKSLALANFAAAMHSVRQQDFKYVEEVIIVDNDTQDSAHELRTITDALAFPIPVRIFSYKHGDPEKTHSWSTNMALSLVQTPWVLFTRADYILDFFIVRKFYGVVEQKGPGWNGFITGHVFHLAVDVGVCETYPWRLHYGPEILKGLGGVEDTYTNIDAGVWMMRKEAFDKAEGLNENLTAWGHAQTHFQYKLSKDGVQFEKIREALFFHPLHSAPRDLDLANRQLAEQGIKVQVLWERYEGAKPY